jgi:hypothetical protein
VNQRSPVSPAERTTAFPIPGHLDPELMALDATPLPGHLAQRHAPRKLPHGWRLLALVDVMSQEVLTLHVAASGRRPEA